ncbi:type 4a pilus biogenesis protein PilO [Patescibacteria group bacterium]
MSRFIIPTFLIIVSAGLFFMYTDPLYKGVQSLLEEKNQYDEAFNSSKELKVVRDKLLSKYNTFTEGNINRLEKLLPDHIDNVRLVMDINNIAAKYGMTIKDVKVGVGGGEVSVLGASEKPFGSITLGFSVTTSYQNFMNLIQDLHDSLRLVDIVDVSFRSSQASLYKYDLTIKTYWLR